MKPTSNAKVIWLIPMAETTSDAWTLNSIGYHTNGPQARVHRLASWSDILTGRRKVKSPAWGERVKRRNRKSIARAWDNMQRSLGLPPGVPTEKYLEAFD